MKGSTKVNPALTRNFARCQSPRAPQAPTGTTIRYRSNCASTTYRAKRQNVQLVYKSTAKQLRSLLIRDRITPAAFLAIFEEVPPQHHDAWLDLLCEIDEIPDDDPELPRGCAPYLPCAVATVVDAIGQANVTANDVFVDVGAGAGRATLLAHLLTGARGIGLEIQPTLVRAAQARSDRLKLSSTRFIQGDAATLIPSITMGTVFFLYCPFGGDRLRHFVDGLENLARSRQIRICCVDMPRLRRPWLAKLPSTSANLDVYQSTYPCLPSH